MTVKTLEPHQQRVVAERDECQTRVSKLDDFMHSDKFKSVHGDEQVRLARQSSLMHQLIETLNERIAAF